jgi:segregation and condensation protein B
LKASQIVEGVLFASDAPLKAEEIARADEALDEDRVEEAIQELRTLYDETERAFQVVELGEGYQILTRSEFAPYLERFDTVPRPSRLSGPALETLAIIAYRQPIGRIEIEYIRGVGSTGVIRTLQDRDLINVVGRAEGLGRPLLYGTTQRFLEHFGFASLDELPRPEELPIVLRDRSPLEELVEVEDGTGEGGVDEPLPQEELALAEGGPDAEGAGAEPADTHAGPGATEASEEVLEEEEDDHA